MAIKRTIRKMKVEKRMDDMGITKPIKPIKPIQPSANYVYLFAS